MAVIEIPIPIKGFSEGLPVDKEQLATSGFILNCRPRDVLEGKLRLGQRLGLKKAYSQQISGTAYPIIILCSVTVVS